MGLLGFTLATDAAVGTNLRGRASGGGWLYCLPRLHHGLVVCLGAPPPATLAALARAGDQVTVLADTAAARSRVRRLATDRVWPHVTVRRWTRADADPTGEPIDLLVVRGTGSAATRRRATGLAARLADDGVAYHEPAWTAGEVSSHRLTVAITPARGEGRSVVPVGDAAMRAAFERLRLEGTMLRRPKLARWERQVTELLGLRRMPRFATLVGGPAADLSGVPHYLRRVAAADNYPLDGWTYGVSARGDYDSQKVLVLLAAGPDDAPSGVVKVTRSQEHAARLQNEATVLRQLAQLSVAKDRVPDPWFSGFHAGRAVLGTSFMVGDDYLVPGGGPRGRTPQLADALGWLTDLGRATAHPVPAGDMAAVLLVLLERYEQVYAPDRRELARLRELFEALGSHRTPVPSVLQHGDPGVWNLLVDGQGRCVFLDWEAGEPDGMPLWDVLYLFRSHAMRVARRAGIRDDAEAAARDLTGPGPLADLLVATVEDYCARVGVAPHLVEALTMGCWVHRAVKESARNAAGDLAGGLSVRLLRRLLADPDAPTLRRLRQLGTGPSSPGEHA
jgi:aminoglycoside phosphotransferase (APT) family kinase protein